MPVRIRLRAPKNGKYLYMGVFTLNNYIIKIAALVLLASTLIASFVYSNWSNNRTTFVVESPNLLLRTANGGSSSAVHIGNGYILTSHHGLSSDRIVTLFTQSGVEIEAQHLWSAERHDIALYLAADYSKISSYTLDCTPLLLHDQLYFIGNPLMMRDITMIGTVAGNSLYNIMSTWAHVVPVQVPIIPGMSGGAVIDIVGNLRGINIGTMIHNQGFAFSYTGLSYIVPSEVVCMLLNQR